MTRPVLVAVMFVNPGFKEDKAYLQPVTNMTPNRVSFFDNSSSKATITVLPPIDTSAKNPATMGQPLLQNQTFSLQTSFDGKDMYLSDELVEKLDP